MAFGNVAFFGSNNDGIGIKNSSISRTLFIYLFKETFFSFLVAFAFFFFIFFVNQLLLMAKDILSKKVPFEQVSLLILYSIPGIIAMSTPFASLLGTLITIGRLTSDNEILVILSSGLSYRNIFTPALLVGVIVALFSFVANDVLLPIGTIQFRSLYRRILNSTPALEIEANTVKKFGETAIITGDVNGKEIKDMMIIDRTSEGERRVISAQSAEFVDAGKEGIRLDMNNAFILTSKEVQRRNYDYADTGVLRYRIQPDELMQNTATISAREMSSRDVWTSIRDKEKSLSNQLNERNNRTIQAAIGLENAVRKGPSSSEWKNRGSLSSAFNRDYQISKALLNDRNLLIFKLEFYKKFSLPFGAFAFIVLAVPLGLFAKKSGQAVGFILGIFISFLDWAMLLGGQNMGLKLGFSPFWAMWTPDILVVVIGVILCLLRVRK